MDLYHMLYLVAEFFMTILLYLTMHLFFEEQRTSRIVELISYIAYYGLSVFFFLWFRIPIVLMISSLILMFLISLNYIAYLGKRMIFTGLTSMIFLLAELLGTSAFGRLGFSLFRYYERKSEASLVLYVVISLILVLIIRQRRNLKKNIKVPLFYWVATGSSIAGLLYGILLILEKNMFSEVEMSVLTLIALGVCFMFVVMYDVLYGSFLMENEKRLAEQERAFYQKQAELMQEAVMQQKILRHDLKNHLVTLQALSQETDDLAVADYVTSLLGSINWQREIFTGNSGLDSILNFKLSGLREQGIEPVLDIQVPQDMKLLMTDMTIILGNLLDNALQAVAECEKERYLRIKIHYGKQGLLINIINSYQGARKQRGGGFQTTKAEKADHGLGLKSVRQVVERAGGSMELTARDGRFEATIIYPLT
ncbi:GHKL domain-containing protein [Clostridiales bacterium COT073_COT-073]|nr:GHKL domain-containing protein [Clostridiales bacterium COT073_COT-073]